MIHIEQGQKIPENENILVASQTGDYEDMAQIEYYCVDNPDIVLGAFQAQFIKYGGLVYRFGDPRELGAEILKVDPESTHSAASFVRMQNELLKQFDQGNLEPESLNQAMADEQATMEDQITNPIDQNSTSTPTTNEITDNTIIQPSANNVDNSTTSTPIIDNSNNLPTSNSTSTTSTIQDNSTTTDQIINNILDNTNQTTTPAIEPQVAGISTSTTGTTTSTPSIPEIVNATSTPFDPTSTVPVMDSATTSSVIENEIINNSTSTPI